MRLRIRQARRLAFTLIELLVVIVIIIILMGMLMAAVQKVFVYLDEVKTSSEIDRMTQNVDAFRTSLGSYPPSRIRLIEQPMGAVYYDPANAFDMFSVDTLRRLFPGIYISIGDPASSPPHMHNWDGSTDASGNPTIQAGVDVVLQGDECLVFFLGGIPAIDAAGVISGQGFCTDKTNPTLPTPGRTRIGPFFEFKTDRLVIDAARRANNRFAIYRDVWNTPYAYFQSRYAAANSYPCALSNPAQPNDCQTLTGVFRPYWQTVKPGNFYMFHRADSFQIISAGRDKEFFTPIPAYTAIPGGGRFDPANPEQYLTMAERDNFTNFHSGALAPR